MTSDALHRHARLSHRPRDGFHAERYARRPVAVEPLRTVYVRNGYTLAPCTGAAHQTPGIDTCTKCAPLWGVMVVPTEKKR